MTNKEGKSTLFPEYKTQIFKLPEPQYMRVTWPNHKHNYDLPGIYAISNKGIYERYLYFGDINISNIDFTNFEIASNELAENMAKVMSTVGDVALGPAINLKKCNQKKTHIETITDPWLFGLYLDAKKPVRFDIAMYLAYPIENIKERNPQQFENFKQKVLSTLSPNK